MTNRIEWNHSRARIIKLADQTGDRLMTRTTLRLAIFGIARTARTCFDAQDYTGYCAANIILSRIVDQFADRYGAIDADSTHDAALEAASTPDADFDAEVAS